MLSDGALLILIYQLKKRSVGFFLFLGCIATKVRCFSMSKSHADSDRSFNVKRHKKDEQSLHRLLLAVAFNYIN